MMITWVVAGRVAAAVFAASTRAEADDPQTANATTQARMVSARDMTFPPVREREAVPRAEVRAVGGVEDEMHQERLVRDRAAERDLLRVVDDLAGREVPVDDLLL